MDNLIYAVPASGLKPFGFRILESQRVSKQDVDVDRML